MLRLIEGYFHLADTAGINLKPMESWQTLNACDLIRQNFAPVDLKAEFL
jgi:hypothetical protein